jgi:predicted PurR-regulated permease PerM
MTTPESNLPQDGQHHEADDHSQRSELEVAISPAGHLSDTVNMGQWLRLLVVVTTLLLLLLTVAVTVRLLSSIGHTLLLFALGGLLAYALDPLVEKLRGGRKERRARTRSVMIVFVLLLLAGTLAAELLSSSLVRQIRLLSEDHAIYLQAQRDREAGILTSDEARMANETYEARAEETLRRTDGWLADRNIHLNLQDQFVHPRGKVKTFGENFAGHALRALEEISKSVVEGAVIVIITLYFLIYCEEMRRTFNRALPERLRPYAETWQDDVNRILGGFVRGQLVLALIIGAMAAGLCLLLGLRIWLLIGLFVVVAALIPVVGPFIGAIPAVISAAITPAHGFMTPVVRAVIVLIAFAIINEVGSKILYPKLVGKALGLHEVLVLFILLAGFEAAGLTGVLFAAPLTALTAVTLAQLYRLWQGKPPKSLAAAQQEGANEVRAQGVP